MKVARDARAGFSLIELMIVVVILGLLAAIAVPNYVAVLNRAREGKVKTNAHTLRLAIEEFAVNAEGTYPALAEVDASLFGAPGLPENPFTGAPVAIAALGYSRGNLGYELLVDVYTIEGYGTDVTSGTLSNGVVITLHN